ncbi:hypothetical protein SPRG_16503, partial [Saprolegnia parasitica CBS 223.65]
LTTVLVPMAVDGYLVPHDVLALELVCKELRGVLIDASSAIWQSFTQRYGGLLAADSRSEASFELVGFAHEHPFKVFALRDGHSFDLDPRLADAPVDGWRCSFPRAYSTRYVHLESAQWSVFNQTYRCAVLGISFSKGAIELRFHINGNHSLGGLQDPWYSKLRIDDECLRPTDVWLTDNHSKCSYAGVLRFRVALARGRVVQFTYGYSGYSTAFVCELTETFCRQHSLEHLLEDS